jgi:peptidyl-tRNA hydrolase
VLGDFRTTERKKIDAALPDVYTAVRMILNGRLADAMTKFNTAPASSEA